MLFSWEWLYKDVGDHVGSWDIDQFDQSLLCGLSNEVELHVNVLRPIVMPWVLRKVDGSLIISKDYLAIVWGFGRGCFCDGCILE